MGQPWAWLEANLVITRNKRAHAGNRGSTSDIYFTPRVLDMLHLSITTPSELKPGVIKPVIRREVSDAGEVKYNRSNLVKVGKVRLPSDLISLVTSGGLAGTAVCKLMTLARKAGQRLSDVLAACQKYLTGMSGRQLFSYLKAAATGKRDIAKEMAVRSEEQRAHQARLAEEQAKRKADVASSKAVGQANLAKGALIRSLSQTRLEALLANWVTKSPGRTGSRVDNKLFLGALRGMSEAELRGRAA